MPDVTPKQATIICPCCDCGSAADKYILGYLSFFINGLKCPRCGQVFEISFKEATNEQREKSRANT